MEFKKLISALNGLKIQTGGIICLGCGYEHSCSTRGCKIIRETVDTLKLQSKRIERYSEMLHNAMDFRCDKCEYSRDNDMRCMCDKRQWAGRMVKEDNYCGYFERRNDPLTLEELRQTDAPVWCLCEPIEGGNGFWCVCKNGYIVTPAGSCFRVEEIPHWVFLRSKPRENDDDT